MRQASVDSFTLNLVVGSVNTESGLIRGFIRPYADGLLDDARAQLPGAVVFRWADEIVAVPFDSTAPGHPWSPRTIDPQAATVLRRIVEAGVCRTVEGWGYTRDPGARVVFVDRKPDRDFIAQWPALARSLPFIHAYPRWELTGRVLRRRGQPVLPGLLVGTKTRVEIDETAELLRDRGLDLVGREVLWPEPTSDGGTRLRSAGRVVLVEGDIATAVGPDGSQRLALRDLRLAGRRETVNDLVALAGDSARAQWDSAQRRMDDWKSPPKRLARLRSFADRLSRGPIDLGGGAALQVRGLEQVSAGTDEGRFAVLESPVYVFDVGRTRTDAKARSGLDRHGPFSKEQFGTRVRRAVVVTPTAFKGSAELFMRSLLDGIPNARVYGSGFARKYRVTDLELTFQTFEVTRPEARGYREACKDALAAGELPDLAFVVIEERHRHAGSDDPYLVAKSLFLSQGVPVQELELETINSPAGARPFILDNVALAAYAKMGGTPFVMAAQTPMAHELVFGIGSALVQQRDGGPGERVVGITSVFSADGNYLLSHRSTEVPFREYPSALAESLTRTVGDVAQRNGWADGDEVRLVFHGFHRMRNENARAIKTVVEALGRYRVEYAFVHVNEDHDWFLFDTRPGRQAPDGLVPDRGRVVPLSRSEALLTVTGPAELRNRPGLAPQPLVIELHPESTFKDLGYLANQVYRFTAMSWRSFAPSARPITIAYSDRIASLLGRLRDVPNWNADVLDSHRMRQSRWFL